MPKPLRALRLLLALCAVGIMVLCMIDSSQEESVDFVPSPETTIVQSIPCSPVVEGTIPSFAIVLPPGEDEPVKSPALVGPALEYVFENGPYIGVVMDFCGP